MHIAAACERMPQKSTDFYPKLLTGLIFMRMGIKKSLIKITNYNG